MFDTDEYADGSRDKHGNEHGHTGKYGDKYAFGDEYGNKHSDEDEYLDANEHLNEYADEHADSGADKYSHEHGDGDEYGDTGLYAGLRERVYSKFTVTNRCYRNSSRQYDQHDGIKCHFGGHYDQL